MSEIARSGAARRVDHPHFRTLRRHVEHALGIAGQQQTLDAQRKADAGRRRPAERLNQPVVATTAADRVLGSIQARGTELESGACVVVEPAHQLGLHGVLDPKRVQALTHPLEVGRRLCGEIVGDLRGFRSHCSGVGTLGIQDAQRVALDLVPILRVDVAGPLLQVRAERVVIGGTGFGVAHRIHQQRRPLQPDRPEELRSQGDDFHIGVRVVSAERLGPDLVELAVAAGLGRFVTEERPLVPDLPRRGGTVLRECPAHRRRALRAQCQVAIAAIKELVHLLADHIGALPDAREDADVLEDRRLQVAESGAVRCRDERAQQRHPATRFGWRQVVRPDGGPERLRGRCITAARRARGRRRRSGHDQRRLRPCSHQS